MAIEMQTKRISELGEITHFYDDGDCIIVELEGGNTKKMTYASLLNSLREELIPNAHLDAMIREQRCINEGVDGIIWDIDDLYTMLHTDGGMGKIAIGDCIIDNNKHWRIVAKNHYSKFAFSLPNVPPHLVLVCDEGFGPYKYNNSSSKSNEGGYGNSLMPDYLDGDVLPSLSQKLRGCISNTQTYENNKANKTLTTRLIRIPTVLEFAGFDGGAYGGNAIGVSCGVSSQFPLFKSIVHRGRAGSVWCQDPSYSGYNSTIDANYFVAISGDSIVNYPAYNEHTVRPLIVMS